MRFRGDIQIFWRHHKVQQNAPRRTTQLRVIAEKCVHCGRPRHPPSPVDVVGPECVKKCGPLLAVLEATDGLEAYEYDQRNVRLAFHTYHDLRRVGIAVKLVEVRPGVKALQVQGLSRKPKLTTERDAEIREAFENRLRLASAKREVQSWVAA